MTVRPRPVHQLVPADRLPGVVDLLSALTEDRPLERTLPCVVDAAADLTGAAFGVLAVLDDEGRMRDLHVHGLDDDAVAGLGPLPVGRGVLGQLLSSPTPLRLQHLGERPHPEDLPPGHPDIETFLGVGIDHGGQRLGMLYLAKPADEAFTADDEELVAWLADRVGQAIALDVARRRARRRSEWLQVSSRLAELLQPPLSTERAMTYLTELVSWIFHARSVALGRLVEGDLVIASESAGAIDDVPAEELAPGTPIHAGVLTAYAERRPVVVRVRGTAVVLIPLPLRLSERTVLGIELRRDAPEPDHEELELLASFTSQATASIDRLNAIAERQEMMVLADRERIARDLHDVVIQRLFASGLQLQGLRRHVPEEKHARVDEVVGDLDQTIRDIRTTIFELGQSRSRSLRGEVAALCGEYGELLASPPSLGVVGPVDTVVSSAVADSLLATLRETLSNAVRHARATHVTVNVAVEGGVLVLEVADDGVGMSGRQPESGLVNVRRRAQELGGSVVIGSGPGRGTTVAWAVPLPD